MLVRGQTISTGRFVSLIVVSEVHWVVNVINMKLLYALAGLSPGRSATGFPWSLLGHYLTMDR